MTEESIQEKARTTPVFAAADVLVVGGGPAGLAAAIASARQGVETMLVERYGCFGGMITQAGVEAVAWYRHEGVREAGGLLLEFEERARQAGASEKECQSESQALDPELFKCVCDDILAEAGVRLLLHSFVADVFKSGDGCLEGVICESKGGRFAIRAKQIIDCTGDADVAYFAGAPFRKAEKGELMAVTQMFTCRGVDVERFASYVVNELKPTYRDWGGSAWGQVNSGEGLDMFTPYLEKPFAEAAKTGELRLEDPGVTIGGTWSTMTPEGEVTQLNLVFMRGIDPTDVGDLTLAEIRGRVNCLKALRILREKVPGFSRARLRNFGMTLGTRESRLIEGRYSITAKDVFEQGRFHDSIAIFPEFIDGRKHLVLPLTGRYYEIPYRALVPKKVENLLVAGRCISGEPMAHTSFRNMSCCVATGQAAGTAAALSVKKRCLASEVDICLLQEKLVGQGVCIH